MIPFVKNAPKTTIQAQNPPSSSLFSVSLDSVRTEEYDPCKICLRRFDAVPLHEWVWVDPSAVPVRARIKVSETSLSSPSKRWLVPIILLILWSLERWLQENEVGIGCFSPLVLVLDPRSSNWTQDEADEPLREPIPFIKLEGIISGITPRFIINLFVTSIDSCACLNNPSTWHNT